MYIANPVTSAPLDCAAYSCWITQIPSHKSTAMALRATSLGMRRLHGPATPIYKSNLSRASSPHIAPLIVTPTLTVRPLATSIMTDIRHGETKYTTAFALFEALWEAGITACFVNIGSDHPSIVEAIIKGKRERPNAWPRIITCPSKITAISIADGHARVTRKPQAVIVHVDVGTQALGQGVHNTSISRAPIFIFTSLYPYTKSGKLKGSRTKYMH